MCLQVTYTDEHGVNERYVDADGTACCLPFDAHTRTHTQTNTHTHTDTHTNKYTHALTHAHFHHPLLTHTHHLPSLPRRPIARTRLLRRRLGRGTYSMGVQGFHGLGRDSRAVTVSNGA